ncbi:GNAT family N-acetyltransferase [Lactobacillus sp. S2-2]|uniref:GNAT family N-acetyltransferase n=1 Tax=Lactobacillus sp. S2-2 TaxID=2692917 RepID=UPI001F03073C|nr:GNAT family N-acetyltransferase [Lactobacillus sp. S2-2]MCF6514914.1 GNAT family N-acetyltransferase [Lactobacillus sp. S2-2]
MKIIKKKTNELTNAELLSIMKERINVFVVEQNCPYPEIDKKDFDAIHLFIKINNEITAYTRIVPHDNGKDISFGRVLVKKEYRKEKLGHKIVQATLDEINKEYPNKNIKIAGQEYLKDFYQSFGFKPVSEIYLEDNIPHIDLLIKKD